MFDAVASGDDTFFKASFDTQQDARAIEAETREENEEWARKFAFSCFVP